MNFYFVVEGRHMKKTVYIQRCRATGHLASFQTLLNTWNTLGGQLPQAS
ncbi:MAG: hypothetical protein H7839_10700 [Magnetococcus sp. YQC-5]